jgi:hypothetical protein
MRAYTVPGQAILRAFWAALASVVLNGSFEKKVSVVVVPTRSRRGV